MASAFNVPVQAWDKINLPHADRKTQLGKLVGTHAHEQSMLLQQLLASFDHQAGQMARLHGTVRDCLLYFPLML